MELLLIYAIGCTCQFLIGKVKREKHQLLQKNWLVSIPHRQGKTTAFSVIIITILAISSQIKLFLSKKSVDHIIIIFAEFLIKSAFQALFTIFSNCVQISTDFFVLFS